MGPEMIPKWTPNGTRNGPQMGLRMEPKMIQNGSQMEPKWGPQWTPFYHFPLRGLGVLFRKWLCFVRPGALFRNLEDHDMDPKWTPT